MSQNQKNVSLWPIKNYPAKPSGPSKATARCYTSICDGIIFLDIEFMTYI